MKAQVQYAFSLMLILPLVVSAQTTKDWQVDGFATIGAQQVNQSNVRFGANTKNEPDWVSASVLGLQGNYKLSSDLSVTGQFLVRPDESDLTRLAPKVEWLFASYRLNDDLMVRAGQLRLPLYMYSEKLYVGKAYPMASLPTEVYGSAATNTYQGADILWRTEVTNDMELLIQPYAGRFETSTLAPDKQNYFNVELKNLYGANAQLQTASENLKLRAGYFNSDLVYPGYPAINATLKTLGVSYRKSGWFLLSELSSVSLNFMDLKDMNGWYLLAGKQLGKWFPYVSYGKKQMQANSLGETDTNTTTLGLSYLIDDKSIIKTEYAHTEHGNNNTSTDVFYMDNLMPLQGKSADMIRASYSLLF